MEDKNKFESYLDFDEIPIEYVDDFEPYEAILLH